MKNKETIKDFHTLHGQLYTMEECFNVYKRDEFSCSNTPLPHNRRDFYKITLIINGQGILTYADKTINIKENTLVFMNPLIPYSWEPQTTDQTGYFCIFTDEFLQHKNSTDNGLLSHLFKVGGKHIFPLEESNMTVLVSIFENMVREMHADYFNKIDLLRNYVQIIMHETVKIQSPNINYHPTNSSERICKLFIELLERQFPIDNHHPILKLKNANEYAAHLNIHTNTLNRAVKETIGKTTSECITDYILKEAKTLLQLSSWDISEIGYSLGFEHVSNFISFFKKHAGKTPKAFRVAIA